MTRGRHAWLAIPALLLLAGCGDNDEVRSLGPLHEANVPAPTGPLASSETVPATEPAAATTGSASYGERVASAAARRTTSAPAAQTQVAAPATAPTTTTVTTLAAPAPTTTAATRTGATTTTVAVSSAGPAPSSTTTASTSSSTTLAPTTSTATTTSTTQPSTTVVATTAVTTAPSTTTTTTPSAPAAISVGAGTVHGVAVGLGFVDAAIESITDEYGTPSDDTGWLVGAGSCGGTDTRVVWWSDLRIVAERIGGDDVIVGWSFGGVNAAPDVALGAGPTSPSLGLATDGGSRLGDDLADVRAALAGHDVVSDDGARIVVAADSARLAFTFDQGRLTGIGSQAEACGAS